MQERHGAVTFKGNPMTSLGDALQAGDQAPEFTVVANNLTTKNAADVLQGKVTVLSVVPSLDTGICDAQTRRFNEEAGNWGDKAHVATISADLPFAQTRWCGAAGIEHVTTYSDHRDLSFGQAYGCAVKELRLLQRSIFIVDASGTIRYVEYVPEIAQHPDYDKALAALKEII